MQALKDGDVELIKEAIKHGEVIRSWLRPGKKRVADRLAKAGVLEKGQMDTGSCVSRAVNFRFELNQVPLKCLPTLYDAGVLQKGAITGNLRKGDRVLFTKVTPVIGGRVVSATGAGVWIERADGKSREYTYPQILAMGIVWVHV